VTELYLIRHARALEQAASDWERPLMAEGRREARAVGAALKKAGVHLDAIGCSPLVRAVETATLMAVELGYDAALSIDAAYTPDGTTTAMLNAIGHLTGERVAIVGHEPSMGLLLSDLIGRPGMSMVKAGVAKLSVEGPPSRGAAKLVWTMSPRQLTPQRGG